MLYSLFVPLSQDISLFNVFRYITFRASWAMLFALVITILAGPRFIALLHRLKFGQQIHEDVMAHKAKAGTPTMGGLLMAFGTVTGVLVWADLSNIYIWLTLFVYLGFGSVGLLDDWLKIHHHQNKGLSARAKFLGQMLVAGLALIVLLQEPAYSSRLAVPFFKQFMPDLGWFYLVFAMVVLVGSSNAVNLTDGLDGLAILPVVMCTGVYAIFVYVAGNSNFAQYLQVPFVPGVGEAAVFCGALMGAGLGFLWFNAQPAQVFMGDVGSLSLGGVIGFIAVLCKQELILVVAGGLFVIETMSVILQVAYFRSTGGKRLFRMAPLHHHCELKGLPESKIIVRFWIVSVLFALAALSVLKLR
ncbi:MAG: phospho-N-acetylmuramoyl-pentapeptide-transferase [Desulfovibrionaceae bacterium]|nr:phospho-N-acetylmuramoyl-pentapeptide-transferase [Desulfovibrionaceae bacterium]